MSRLDDPSARARVLIPTGMLGSGFPTQTVWRGIAMGAHAIAVDAGSTDSGPYYLGTATAKTTIEAVTADLRVLVRAAATARIPLIVGSCGTGGTDAGVDRVFGSVETIAASEGLRLRVARVYSEQRPVTVTAALGRGRVHPLDPAAPLTEDTARACEHIVGLMGHEPIAAAVEAGADIVLAGRATDTALMAAVPLQRGCPPGPTWHAAKIAECGGLCTQDPRSGGVLIEVDQRGFVVEPLDPATACSPTSVAAHMLYENADPFRMREPAGTLDVSGASYRALDDRRVRVTGSVFVPAAQYSVKLEGAARRGYETVSLVGIRDPAVLRDIATWVDLLTKLVADRVATVLRLPEASYRFTVRCYGWNGVLGPLDPATDPPREVAAMLVVSAPDQATATSIAKLANPLLLHLPLPGFSHLPSYAFAFSPAEIERGPRYEFMLNHVIDVDDPAELFRTVFTEVGA